MPLNDDEPLAVSSSDPSLALRRRMLVTGLLTDVVEVRALEDGYAFKFRRVERLIRRLADYILFESGQSPWLTFVLTAESKGGWLWLEVRGSDGEKERIRAVYGPFLMSLSP